MSHKLCFPLTFKSKGMSYTLNQDLTSIVIIVFRSVSTMCETLCSGLGSGCLGLFFAGVDGCSVVHFDILVEMEEPSRHGTEIFVTEDVILQYKGTYCFLLSFYMCHVIRSLCRTQFPSSSSFPTPPTAASSLSPPTNLRN